MPPRQIFAGAARVQAAPGGGDDAPQQPQQEQQPQPQQPAADGGGDAAASGSSAAAGKRRRMFLGGARAAAAAAAAPQQQPAAGAAAGAGAGGDEEEEGAPRSRFDACLFAGASRDDAERSLAATGVGTFLLRPSSQASAVAALSKHAPPPLGVAHFLVLRAAAAGGGFLLGDSLDETVHASLDALVAESSELRGFACAYLPPGATAPLTSSSSSSSSSSATTAAAAPAVAAAEPEQPAVPGARAAFRHRFESTSTPAPGAAQPPAEDPTRVSVFDFGEDLAGAVAQAGAEATREEDAEAAAAEAAAAAEKAAADEAAAAAAAAAVAAEAEAAAAAAAEKAAADEAAAEAERAATAAAEEKAAAEAAAAEQAAAEAAEAERVAAESAAAEHAEAAEKAAADAVAAEKAAVDQAAAASPPAEDAPLATAAADNGDGDDDDAAAAAEKAAADELARRAMSAIAEVAATPALEPEPEPVAPATDDAPTGPAAEDAALIAALQGKPVEVADPAPAAAAAEPAPAAAEPASAAAEPASAAAEPAPAAAEPAPAAEQPATTAAAEPVATTEPADGPAPALAAAIAVSASDPRDSFSMAGLEAALGFAPGTAATITATNQPEQTTQPAAPAAQEPAAAAPAGAEEPAPAAAAEPAPAAAAETPAAAAAAAAAAGADATTDPAPAAASGGEADPAAAAAAAPAADAAAAPAAAAAAAAPAAAAAAAASSTTTPKRRAPPPVTLNTREGCFRARSLVMMKLIAGLEAAEKLFEVTGSKPAAGQPKDLPKKIKMLSGKGASAAAALAATQGAGPIRVFQTEAALAALVEECGVESTEHALTVLQSLQVEGLIESASAASPLDVFPSLAGKAAGSAFFFVTATGVKAAEVAKQATAASALGNGAALAKLNAGVDDAPSAEDAACLPARFDAVPHLLVRVIEASNLITRDSGAACDPYVSITWGTLAERRTQTVKKSFAPVYNEVLRMPVPGVTAAAAASDPAKAAETAALYARQHELDVTIGDKKLLMARRHMGTVRVPAAGLVRGRELVWRTQVRGEGVTSGNIFVCLTAVNFGHLEAQSAAQWRLLRGLNPRVDNRDAILDAVDAGADVNVSVMQADVAEAHRDRAASQAAMKAAASDSAAAAAGGGGGGGGHSRSSSGSGLGAGALGAGAAAPGVSTTPDAAAAEPLGWSSDPQAAASALAGGGGPAGGSGNSIVTGTAASAAGGGAAGFMAPVFCAGACALHLYSRREGGPGAVQALLASGAQVGATDSYRRTPLHFAAAFCSLTIAQTLIAAGADVGAKDVGGRTPLHYAVSYRVSSLGEHNRVLDVLLAIAAGKLIAAPQQAVGNTPGGGSSAVLTASGAIALAKMAQQAGVDAGAAAGAAAAGGAGVVDPADAVKVVGEVDLAAVDNDGNTALHLAAAMGNRTTTQLLLDAGIAKHAKIKNKRGKMALQEGLFDMLKPHTFATVG